LWFREDRDLHDARAITIVRPGQHPQMTALPDSASDTVTVSIDRSSNRRRDRVADHRSDQQHREQRDRNVQPVDRGETEVTVLLKCAVHRHDLRGDVMLDDAVSVRQPADGAFAGRDIDKLTRSRGERSLRLPERIVGERTRGDVAISS
jgi:hypothetical protein